MISVRKAVVSDAENMAKVEAASLDFPWTAEQIASEIVSDDAVFLVAETDGEYAGHLSGRIADEECELSNVVVAEKFRRQGVAQTLFDYFFNAVYGLGAWDLYITVRETNVPAIGLYQKIGFKPLGRRRGYYKGVDGIIMRKVLAHGE